MKARFLIFAFVLGLMSTPAMGDSVLIDGWKPLADVTHGITSDPDFVQSGWTGEPGQFAGVAFSLSLDSVITGIHWVGFYHNGVPVPDDSFTFELYQGLGPHNPPNLLATLNPLSLNRFATTFTSVSGAGATIYEYWIDLGEYNIEAGNYILSIVNAPVNDNWAWGSAQEDDSVSFSRHPLFNFDWTGASTSLSYQIDGHEGSTVPSPVPEPATLTLLGMGLLAGAAFRKRFK